MPDIIHGKAGKRQHEIRRTNLVQAEYAQHALVTCSTHRRSERKVQKVEEAQAGLSNIFLRNNGVTTKGSIRRRHSRNEEWHFKSMRLQISLTLCN